MAVTDHAKYNSLARKMIEREREKERLCGDTKGFEAM